MTDHEYDAEFAAWLAGDPPFEVETHVIHRKPVPGERFVRAVFGWSLAMAGVLTLVLAGHAIIERIHG